MAITRRKALFSAGTLAGLSFFPLKGQRETGEQTATATESPSGAAAELVSLPHIEAIARTRLSEAAYGFISGGGANENTLHWNREAFDRMRLRPRILVDVAKIDTRVTLFGEQLPFPLLLAPTGRHRAIHREGELGTAKGAGAARTVMTVSTMATTAVEDIAKVASSPLWFQLYILGDRSFTRDLVQRAENAGCKAICVTVDTAGSGARDRETRANFRNPPGVDQPHVRGLKRVTMDPSMTWKDIEWLRSFARVPVLLKGVLNPSDAEQAAREGVAGIIVSNHGGRQLDTVPATIDALPEIVEKVGGRAPVLLDGGIRRGTDILKALALGAQAVLVGRPYLYGLGVAGAEGVTRVIDILRTELQWAMALTGKTSIASIDRSVLWPAPMRS